MMIVGALLAGPCAYAIGGGVSDREVRRRAAMAYVDARRLASIPREICGSRERLFAASTEPERIGWRRKIRALKDEWKRVRLRHQLDRDEPLPRCDSLPRSGERAHAD